MKRWRSDRISRIARVLLAVMWLGIRAGAQEKEIPDPEIFSRLNAAGGTELARERVGPWTVVRDGDAYGQGRVLSAAAAGPVVLETGNALSGAVVYVEQDGVTWRIEKTLGRQSPPLPLARPASFMQDDLHKVKGDILGREYLSDPADPSYERMRQFTAGFMRPLETYVGMRAYAHEVHVSWDGSVGMDNGFFTGVEGNTREKASALPLLFDGRLLDVEQTGEVVRGLLDGYLPTAHYFHRDPKRKLGWEEIVLMGRVEGKAALFLRARLFNFADRPQTNSLTLAAPGGGSLEAQPGHVLTIRAPFPDPRIMAMDDQALQKRRMEQFAAGTYPVRAIADRPCIVEDGRPVWRFVLEPGGHQDVTFCFPGHDSGGSWSLPPERVRPAFYAALREQSRDWREFLARGTQLTIPEPPLGDIFKAALAKAMVCVDGDEVRGGAVHYEGFWPYCVIWGCQTLLETGYHEEARRYLAHFLRSRIKPNGRFAFNEGEGRYQIFDAGHFLSLVAQYVHYTRDASLLLEHREAIDRVVRMLRAGRETSLAKFPEGDPRRGLIAGTMNNDMGITDYYYTNNGMIWEGLRDYAEALREIGRQRADASLVEQGEELGAYAAAFLADLRKSFESAKETVDGRLSYVHVHWVPADAPRPVPCPYRTEKEGARDHAQMRFQLWPILIGSSLLTDVERAFCLDYAEREHQPILGVRRYVPERLDNFPTYYASFQKLRLGRVREFQMEYYAYLNLLMAPGMWGAFEQVLLRAYNEKKGLYRHHRLEPQSIRSRSQLYGYDGIHPLLPVIRMTMQMFAFDEPGGGAVWIGRGIPKHWMVNGGAAAKGLPTRYGRLNVRWTYDEAARSLRVEIDPLERREIPEVRIGARDPRGGGIAAVRCEPAASSGRSRVQDDLVVVEKIKEPVTVTVTFKDGPNVGK